jgi:hypothetical protein
MVILFYTTGAGRSCQAQNAKISTHCSSSASVGFPVLQTTFLPTPRLQNRCYLTPSLAKEKENLRTIYAQCEDSLSTLWSAFMFLVVCNMNVTKSSDTQQFSGGVTAVFEGSFWRRHWVWGRVSVEGGSAGRLVGIPC